MKLYIKEIRKQKGLSLEALANKSGHSKSTLSCIENGISDPKISTLCDIAKALKIPIEEIVKC